MIINKPY